ncbi:MAG: hypothetical protein EBT22_09715 [Chloroflexi bacterium]|nr:hypothetical protein [Chloroflexota bacterium]
MQVRALARGVRMSPQKARLVVNFSLNTDGMVVVSATADKGPTLPRRFRPRARGQAGVIEKKTTHITVVVSNDIEPTRRGYKRKPA